MIYLDGGFLADEVTAVAAAIAVVRQRRAGALDLKDVSAALDTFCACCTRMQTKKEMSSGGSRQPTDQQNPVPSFLKQKHFTRLEVFLPFSLRIEKNVPKMLLKQFPHAVFEEREIMAKMAEKRFHQHPELVPLPLRRSTYHSKWNYEYIPKVFDPGIDQAPETTS